MYKNVGRKIQILAQVLGWLLLIAGVVVCVVLLANDTSNGYGRRFNTEDNITGYIALAAGIFGFISSWILYGFGQLVDDTHAMREKKDAPVVEKKPLEGGWTCSCGRENAAYISTCSCGKGKHDA